MIDIDFDEVSAVGKLFPHGLADAVDSIGNLRAFGNCYIWRIAVRRVTPGDAERSRSTLHTRTYDQSVVDGIAQRHIAIPRPLGFEVPYRRKPSQQRLPGRYGGPDGAILERLLQQKLVIVDTLQKHVGVAVNQTR